MQDEPEPIPDTYSAELRELISKLMTKNPAGRPSTAEILKMDYVRNRMQRFVEDAEMENNLSNPVFKKQRPTIRRVPTADNNQVVNFTPQQQAETMGTTNSSIPEAQTLTPA